MRTLKLIVALAAVIAAGGISAPGARACADLERRWNLEEIETATLPAVRSMQGHDYLSDVVEIGLYRVRNKR